MPLWLAGCAVPAPPSATATIASPAQWQAPLPHQGRLADLGQWWQRFDDPLLITLITAAQQVSPTLASAAARIEQARSTQRLVGAGSRPQVEAAGSTSRGRQTTLIGAPLAMLSPREQEILTHIASGASNKEIARSLAIAETTVKIHVQHVLRKLEVTTRVHAAVMATEYRGS